ncbi:hypothetical protein EVG20_g5299 [Dentipellis fragilis]|uniref:Uncharacterized protein n=1 Tax=Dentipellis fragilis TaxID=205917 RepID=A0A4Y9YW24_9AGAM|nr:hypothetical protein EVG20_g5299 [Dentipellis fragilis]
MQPTGATDRPAQCSHLPISPCPPDPSLTCTGCPSSWLRPNWRPTWRLQVSDFKLPSDPSDFARLGMASPYDRAIVHVHELQSRAALP